MTENYICLNERRHLWLNREFNYKYTVKSSFVDLNKESLKRFAKIVKDLNLKVRTRDWDNKLNLVSYVNFKHGQYFIDITLWTPEKENQEPYFSTNCQFYYK